MVCGILWKPFRLCHQACFALLVAAIMFLARAAGAGEEGFILQDKDIPLFVDDGRGETYFAVPAEIAAGAIRDVWKKRYGMNKNLADILRLSTEERQLVRGAVKRAWMSMDGCAGLFQVTGDKHELEVKLKEGAGEALLKFELKVTRRLLKDVKEILGDERGGILEAMGLKTLCYNTLEGMRGRLGEVLDKIELSILVDENRSVWYRLYVYRQRARTGSRNSRTMEYLFGFPWPGLAEKAGFTREEVEDDWDGYDPRFEEPAMPEGVPVGALDQEGRYYLFMPLEALVSDVLGPFYNALAAVHTSKWYEDSTRLVFNGHWKTILRLGDAQAAAVLEVLIGLVEALDGLYGDYAFVETKREDEMVLVIAAEAVGAFGKMVDKRLGKLEDILNAGQIAALKRLLSSRLCIESRAPLHNTPRVMVDIYTAMTVSKGTMPLRLRFKRTNKYLKLRFVEETTGRSYSAARMDKSEIPSFVWWFAPQEWKSLAPEGVTPGNRMVGRKVVAPYPDEETEAF